MLKACTALANAQLALASDGGKALVNGVPITAYGWQLQSHGDEGRTFSIVKGDSTLGPFVGADTTFLDEAFKAENESQGREPNPDDSRRFRKRGSTGCGTTKSYKGFSAALRNAVGPVERPAKKAKKVAKSVADIDTALGLAAPQSANTNTLSTDIDTALGLVSSTSAPAPAPTPAPGADWQADDFDVELENFFGDTKLSMDILRKHGGQAARGNTLPVMLQNVVSEASIDEMQAILRSIKIVPLSSAADLRQQLALA